jgi:hypothetical protein
MERGEAGRVFISYRRQETAWPARQLYDLLVAELGADRVFKDVDNISSGEDWVEQIVERTVGSCQVLLVLIGPQWLTITDGNGQRRLDDPTDFVRLAVETALNRDDARVIPILVDDAKMPAPQELPTALARLVYLHPVEISPVNFDTRHLMKVLNDTFSDILPEPVAMGRLGGSTIRSLAVEVVEGDIMAFAADLVAFKYARGFYGADREVAQLLMRAGINLQTPGVGEYYLVNPGAELPARQVLYVGVPSLLEFKYQEIREFGSSVIRILAEKAPTCRHLGMTLHGPNYGLDEVEALLSMLNGCMEEVAKRPPPNLQRVSIVERDPSRVRRLRRALQEAASYEIGDLPVKEADRGWLVQLGGAAGLVGASPHELSRLPGAASDKPHIFVAMPFAEAFNDLFEYGIQRPVRNLGLLCERVDEQVFTGDVLERVKSQIEASTAIIAVLTGANPNVYLEVGYAWGKGRPTILITDDAEAPRFDLRGQRHLKYRRIKDVEETLTRELRILLKGDGRI